MSIKRGESRVQNSEHEAYEMEKGVSGPPETKSGASGDTETKSILHELFGMALYVVVVLAVTFLVITFVG